MDRRNLLYMANAIPTPLTGGGVNTTKFSV